MITTRFVERFKHANIWRIIRLILLFALIVHILGCIWYFVVDIPSDTSNGWKTSYGLEKESNRNAYILSFYAAIGMLLGQNIEAERTIEVITHIVNLMIGAILQAYIFGQVSLLIADNNSHGGQYKVDLIKRMHSTHPPPPSSSSAPFSQINFHPPTHQISIPSSQTTKFPFPV